MILSVSLTRFRFVSGHGEIVVARNYCNCSLVPNTTIDPVHDGFASRSKCGSRDHWCASAVLWQLIFRDGRYGTDVCAAHQQSGMEVCPNSLRDLTRRVNACDRPERFLKIKEEFAGRLFDRRSSWI